MARSPDDVDDATLRLLLASGVGPATMRRVVEHFGSAELAVAASERALCGIQGVATRTANAMRSAIVATDPEGERRAMRERDVRLVLRGDDDYPPLLEPLPAPPEALWVEGAWPGDELDACAVVGTRRPTVYGLRQTQRLAGPLVDAGLVIVSGGAVGIDRAAHAATLRAAGRTIAVLGCGLAQGYPAANQGLFAEIARAGGALVSEFPMGVPPRPQHFPRRNRIISGLSLGVVVIEASRRSGALITARCAADDHGREVMAMPGPVDVPSSAGCHHLLRHGAALVRDAADVLDTLAGARDMIKRASTPTATPLTSSQQTLVDFLHAAGDAQPVERIVDQLATNIGGVLADITVLELRGLAHRPHPGFVAATAAQARVGGTSTAPR